MVKAILFTIPLMLLLTTGLVGQMAYEWSFTETTFGGYLGVAIPVLACLICFALGHIYAQLSRD